jgi:hypothetical protein
VYNLRLLPVNDAAGEAVVAPCGSRHAAGTLPLQGEPALRKPEWHDCPAFTFAWSELAMLVGDPRNDDVEISAMLSVAREAAAARVVKLDIAQVRAVQQAQLAADVDLLSDIRSGV